MKQIRVSQLLRFDHDVQRIRRTLRPIAPKETAPSNSTSPARQFPARSAEFRRPSNRDKWWISAPPTRSNIPPGPPASSRRPAASMFRQSPARFRPCNNRRARRPQFSRSDCRQIRNCGIISPAAGARPSGQKSFHGVRVSSEIAAAPASQSTAVRSDTGNPSAA